MNHEADIALVALDNAHRKAEDTIEAYRGFTNTIDDYFEYRCMSPDDQKFVHKALADLTRQLKKVLG